MSINNIGRNKPEPCQCDRPEPPLSTDKLIAITIPANRNRLDNTIFNDGIFQLLKSCFIKLLAGLKRIDRYFLYRQTANRTNLGWLLSLVL